MGPVRVGRGEKKEVKKGLSLKKLGVKRGKKASEVLQRSQGWGSGGV